MPRLNFEDLDLEHMSNEELHEGRQMIDDMLQIRFAIRSQEFRELARQMGFWMNLTKLGKDERSRSKQPAQVADRRRGVRAKYRNPNNPEETWAGRGRKPRWVEERLSQGTPLDALLINRSAPL